VNIQCQKYDFRDLAVCPDVLHFRSFSSDVSLLAIGFSSIFLPLISAILFSISAAGLFYLVVDRAMADQMAVVRVVPRAVMGRAVVGFRLGHSSSHLRFALACHNNAGNYEDFKLSGI
jgi:hypothetical protein